MLSLRRVKSVEQLSFITKTSVLQTRHGLTVICQVSCQLQAGAQRLDLFFLSDKAARSRFDSSFRQTSKLKALYDLFEATK